MVHLLQRAHRARTVPISGDGSSALSVADDVPVATSAAHSAPTSLVVGGFLALLLSAWAGIVPFVGSSFGFSPDGSPSWTWNLVHALGAVVPGAVGLLACLGTVVAARGAARAVGAARLVVNGLVTFLCGAWFASVPIAWPVLVGGYFHAASPSLTLAYWMGLAIGPGILLAAFGSFTMGRASRGRLDA